MSDFRQKYNKHEQNDFDEKTTNTISRIDHNPNVVGVIFFHGDQLQLCTMPARMTQILRSTLTHFSSLVQQAIGEITASLNNVNPIVDRIMEDDSVEAVILSNEEGVPLITNINVNGATNYSLAMKRLGWMAQFSTKEIDILDEILILRLNTKKIEIMVAPHSEFTIIVVQHAREKKKALPRKYKK